MRSDEKKLHGFVFQVHALNGGVDQAWHESASIVSDDQILVNGSVGGPRKKPLACLWVQYVGRDCVCL